MLKQINEKVLKYPATVFDTFDISIDARFVGGSLRDRLNELSNMYGRINQLKTSAYFLHEEAKNRKEQVDALAWKEVKGQVSDKKILMKNIEVLFNGEITTPHAETKKLNLYAYIHKRGRDKVKEIASALDVGRTLLSYDKQEQGKTQYG